MSVARKIKRFLKISGMPESKFGRLAINDPRLVADMRRGREISDRTAARIEAFIAAQPRP